MATHMSIRLAWHNEGWNGHICQKPCENTYCIGQHSYPGNLIAGTRDVEYETAHAGESCADNPCAVACGLSVNAFGKEPIKVRVDTPDFWKKTDADPIKIELPPYTVCTWCYEQMYNDEVEARGNTKQKYNYAKRKEGAEKYFAQFEPGKSLIFYYVGYSNPFCENEEDNYVIVGISRVKKIEPTYYYDNTSAEVQKKYAGGFVWQRPVTSTYPDEGFCIPYWKYMDDEEIIERILLKPLNRSPFKYGSREVDNDDAIEVVNQLIAVVDVLIEIGDDTEDWVKRKEWLNSVLNELWTARGPYPGFPSVLEYLGLHSLISSYTALETDEDMKLYMQSVRDLLDGTVDEIGAVNFDKVSLKKIRREYQLLGAITVDFLFGILSRFNLSANQVKNIVADNRGKVSITASIEEMADNPYIIFEQYVGVDADDTIPFYRIDNGVIPSPEYGIGEILDNGSTERFRAFCVDELNRIPAHSFGKAETILERINARIDRLPEWKSYVYRMQNFEVETEILDGAIKRKKDDNGILYLYLREVYEDERTVEEVLKNLADRPDITLKMAITPEKFKERLRVKDSPLTKKVPDQYEEILDHQADICMQIFTKPLCVLSGAAGTGKTTVIKSILDNIDRVHGAGTSFLLMAPTGKATERIKTQNEKPSKTIHSHLAKNGWINENFTLKREGGSIGQDYNTIIIDECSMIDLNLFAMLLKSINWNSVQRLILIGDPNQLPPIGRGRVFADTIEWLKKEHPDNVGTLTDNIRQLVNTVEDKGHGILDLAELFIQENQQTEDEEKSAKLKVRREKLFENIVENGNGDVDKDLGVYFWNEQEELEQVLTNVMMRDMQKYTGLDMSSGKVTPDELWQAMIRDKDRNSNPEIIQVISPYRGEFYGTDSLNLLMQRTFNSKWSQKKLDGIGYFDKVIQFRNRPQSDPAYAYQDSTKKNIKAEIYNGEIGLSMIHELDAYSKDGKQPKYKWQGNIDRFQVAFSGKTRKGLRYNYGRDLGQDIEGRWIKNQNVIDNLELAYAISVHKSQGSEFDYVYIVIPHKESHLLSMELLYTAITRAQKKVTIFLQQDIGTLTSLSRPEKSAVKKINSSVFKFDPLPDALLYAKGNWYEDGKNVATLSNYFVRSKSEAIITNMLVDRDIPFKYEVPLYAPDGTMFLPDFTVKFKGEEYYWEHVGMPNNKSYMEHWAKKEKWYNKHFPGKLLTTIESNNLSKDAEELINKYK
jgi:exodeoxyribonuclease V alpha subunit